MVCLYVGCFIVLERIYGRELEAFIKAHINYIIKTEFFIELKTAHFNIMTIANIQADFRGAGSIPHNPQVVIPKLDINRGRQERSNPFFSVPTFGSLRYHITLKKLVIS